jgi:uncharacterized protein (TIGR01777 family)
MKVVISGASGLIGSALARSLTGDGHEVVELVRRDARRPDEASWDPASRRLDSSVLAGADAVVNLAGAGIGDRRWTDDYRKVVLDSRLDATSTIVNGIAELPEAQRPGVLVNASAVGFYGDTKEEAVDENGPPGEGFLVDVVRQWEGATRPAADAGVRVVLARTGVVLAREGGALGKVLPLFKLGLGGKLGSGRQWMSWIALPDEIAALRFLLTKGSVVGPVNLTAPEPTRNRDYTRSIGRAVHRPALAVVPAAALRAALGGFADEGVLVSQRVLPSKLEDAGFTFTYADVDSALAALL